MARKVEPSFGLDVLGTTEERRIADMRISGGCLFWLLVSVVLSVILTVLANLFLILLKC
jgi:hypothetical protein